MSSKSSYGLIIIPKSRGASAFHLQVESEHHIQDLYDYVYGHGYSDFPLTLLLYREMLLDDPNLTLGEIGLENNSVIQLESYHPISQAATSPDHMIREMRSKLVMAEKMLDQDQVLPVLNRRALVRDMKLHILSPSRKLKPSCFAYLDIDRFKSINDTYGHSVGDRVLSYFINILNHAASSLPGAKIGRMGGDEFAVLCRNSSSTYATQILSRVQEYLSEHPLLWEGSSIPITFSYGIVDISDSSGSVDDIIAEADSKMYVMKGRT